MLRGDETREGPDGQAEPSSASPPVARFGARSDALRKRLSRELDPIMAEIPAHEPEVLERAVLDRG